MPSHYCTGDRAALPTDHSAKPPVFFLNTKCPKMLRIVENLLIRNPMVVIILQTSQPWERLGVKCAGNRNGRPAKG